MVRMSHFCRQWQLKPSTSKTISSVFHLHNTGATRELSVYLDGSTLGMSATQPILGWLDRTLSYREHLKKLQASWRPKQLVDEASRFHLGRQRQYSVVICSGALLFSSRVLRPSLVMLCSHKSGQCAVELYHAPHRWHPPFCTSLMASSALQHWTASPMKEGCHWETGGENRQTWQLADPTWYP